MYFKEHAIRELETVICSIIRKCPDKFITLNKFPVKDAYLKCSGLCKAMLFPSLELHKVCYPIIQGLINKGLIHRKNDGRLYLSDEHMCEKDIKSTAIIDTFVKVITDDLLSTGILNRLLSVTITNAIQYAKCNIGHFWVDKKTLGDAIRARINCDEYHMLTGVDIFKTMSSEEFEQDILISNVNVLIQSAILQEKNCVIYKLI